MLKFFFLFSLITVQLIFNSSILRAQDATVSGKVISENGEPLIGANISFPTLKTGTATDAKGHFIFNIPSNQSIEIKISYVGFIESKKTLNLKPGQHIELNFILLYNTLDSIVVKQNAIRDQPIIEINPKDFEALPGPTGGVEAILKLFTNSNNELSSQYSVRGGNFDENLVYVNDFEIYRPFLVNNGQQEGLSFVNSDLVGNILFSQGGFAAKYGDKMSSVLDITYRKPKAFKGNVSASLLGADVHMEGGTKNHRFTYLVGVRQKSNQYILNSLETTGDYKPSFTDAQALITYQFSEKTQLEILGNYSRNRYWFVPQDRTTTFGLVNRAVRLTMYFDGQEIDKFNSGMGGASLSFHPNKNLKLKFLASTYYTREDETFDLIAEYFLGEVSTNLGNANFNQVVYSLGTGAIQDWGRNYLDAAVFSGEHKGSLDMNKHFVQWGIKYNREYISDKLNQWGVVDSAGYNLPYSVTDVNAYYVYKTKNLLESNRYSGFVQDTWDLSKSGNVTLNIGSRFNFWDVNNQFIVSPRAQLSFYPKWDSTDIVFRAAVGCYDQPPFYRELRNLNGNLKLAVKAQRSIHAVLGADYNFKMWDRPFKFITEAYYKNLYDLNPYELDNVRIRYFGNNDAVGYAYGIDLRLHGELVKDVESWVSINYLNTKENLKSDFSYVFDTTFNAAGEITKFDTTTVHPGYVARPSDQRLSVGAFIQDYVPGHENFKVHLNLLFGTGFPTGPPDHNRYADTLRLPSYRRVDIGFSALLLDGKKHIDQKLWKNLSSIWTSLEVFNLLAIPNTISYLWVKDSYQTIYAVPNYLTARRINLRVVMKF
ncbi:TonB-dependent receptor [Bacteroidota bacterium]|nr:TonB-dependent receptor [Bacteroidota bacterium]